MSKHTPGPWKIVDGFMGKIEIESSNERDTSDTFLRFTLARDIGGRVHGEEFDDYSEVEANANLIASAPDLLEALETIKRRMYEPRKFMLQEVEAMVDIAIARAKGESQ